jgi:peptide/nickel transport system substrate-binding protein
LQLREVPQATAISKFCSVPKAAVAICPNLGWAADFFAAQSFIDPLFNSKNIVPSGNVNTAQVDDPGLNSNIEKAKQKTSQADIASAWAGLDKEVTSRAYFLTWLWNSYIGLRSKDVNGVGSKFNGGARDLSFSSLK